jgi:hypothetical protein
MWRAEFEDRVRQGLSPVLTPRGFTLTPQGDVDELEPSAVFEADPGEFGHTYPGFRQMAENLAGSCIDLWVHFRAVTGTIRCELEARDLGEAYRELGHEPPRGLPREVPGDLETQLEAWAPALSQLLDTAARQPR